MDVGSPKMEEVQSLKRIFSHFLAAGLMLVFLSNCTTKKVMEDNNAQFEDINKEFQKVVKVETSPIAVESPVVATPKPSEQKAPIKTSQKLIPKDKVAERLPPSEDSEGFSGRRPIADPFRVNEKVVLTVKYFNADAGELTMGVGPYRTVNGKKAYDFSVRIKSSKKFSLFYAVDNTIDTLVDFETLLPLTYESSARESSRMKDVRAYFDTVKNEATHWGKRQSRKTKTSRRKKLFGPFQSILKTY
jgi:Protein of unknown function (DUF3108)